MNVPQTTRVNEVSDLHFPNPETPLFDHRASISWLEYMDETEAFLLFHLKNHDTPESRLATKIHSRFYL